MVVLAVSLLLLIPRASGWSFASFPRSTCQLSMHSERFAVCEAAKSATNAQTRRGCLASVAALSSGLLSNVWPANAKCANIDECREIGEQRDKEIQKAKPIVRLGNGLVYRILAPGYGTETVAEGKGKVDIAFALYQGNGSYMYSKGMGFNTINVGNQRTTDVGSVDSLLVTMGSKDIPAGVQQAMVGMRKGEKRRINCPSVLGFETSDWNPSPTDFRGRQQITDYKSRLYGRGDTQPAFPAPTIWEIEVLRILR